ncbi:MAG: hypothetical protein QNJ37_19645 [Crocosphaera sp.]|nr:hypothetical protein [Crocosphaera sp.]
MFNIGQAIDLVSDATGNKERTARLIKFFEYKEGGLGIAFFDNQTVHGEYWLGNIPISKESEAIFKNSGFSLGTKYDINFFGLQPFHADKKVLKTPAV